MVQVGFTLQPEERYLELLDSVIREECDYYEVAPETLWFAEPSGRLRPNGFHRRFEELREETGRPFVAHGVGLSVGSLGAQDEERFALWLDTIRAMHEVFEFEWYTDHLGASVLDGRQLTLPLALPMTDDVADHVRGRLDRLREIVPEVGLENSVFYYTLGDPLNEPAFLERIVRGDGLHLLLDLHNLYTSAVNFGFDAEEYLARLPLDKVIEIHLAGGTLSDPAWLPGGETMRLDSHDHAVPDEVWALFAAALPRCSNLRGVTLERMEGTVEADDVEPLRGELRRIRDVVGETR